MDGLKYGGISRYLLLYVHIQFCQPQRAQPSQIHPHHWTIPTALDTAYLASHWIPAAAAHTYSVVYGQSLSFSHTTATGAAACGPAVRALTHTHCETERHAVRLGLQTYIHTYIHTYTDVLTYLPSQLTVPYIPGERAAR
jgi:hypothetical protein